jgi:hypothetical protein
MKETLEETALRLYPRLINDSYNPMEDSNEDDRQIFIQGAKYQQEKMYSEEEVIELLTKRCEYFGTSVSPFDKILLKQDLEWFNEFKKK